MPLPLLAIAARVGGSALARGAATRTAAGEAGASVGARQYGGKALSLSSHYLAGRAGGQAGAQQAQGQQEQPGLNPMAEASSAYSTVLQHGQFG